jgi:phage-related baseplate assembly protein
VAQSKSKEQDQAIRKAIAELTSQGRDLTTSAILATIHVDGIKAKPSDIYASRAWSDLLAQQRSQSSQKQATLPMK